MTHESTARSRALDRLGKIDPVEYEASRNYLDGAVTGLSRFLRHGVLSLTEVRDAVVAKAGGAARGRKLIQELAWRDYYQRLWYLLGDNIWLDIERYKTGFEASDYADILPSDLLNATTGIDYVDYFVEQLHTTGQLHNHARMWLSAYIVHGRRVKWQAGARWFLSYLLDGDEASNNLSWQWCASTFSHKPYFYNRENVLKYSGKRFSRHQANDPFDTDFQTLSRKLFGNAPNETEPQRRFDLRTNAEPDCSASSTGSIDVVNTLVWIHDGMMSPAHPAIAMGEHHVFVWDDQHIAACGHSAARIAFQQSALICPDVHSQGKPLTAALDLSLERECEKAAVVPVFPNNSGTAYAVTDATVIGRISVQLPVISKSRTTPVSGERTIAVKMAVSRERIACEMNRAHEELYKIEATCRAAGIEATAMLVRSHSARGNPIPKIIEEMVRVEPRLTVVGSHGHGRIHNPLLGSVSSEVVRKSREPALVVPALRPT